ncbi:MAG: DNA-directed RNA polymerase subunit alpha C-terminal domain-containing protein [Patescibacteria group bacterium]
MEQTISSMVGQNEATLLLSYCYLGGVKGAKTPAARHIHRIIKECLAVIRRKSKAERYRLITILAQPIDTLELPERLRHVLKRAQIRYLADLGALTEAEFLRCRGVGKRHLDYLKILLAKNNLRFGMTFSDDFRKKLEKAEETADFICK